MNVHETAGNHEHGIYSAVTAYADAVVKMSWIDSIRSWFMSFGHHDAQSANLSTVHIDSIHDVHTAHSESHSPYQDLMLGALVSLDQSLLTAPMAAIFATAFNDYLKVDHGALVLAADAMPDSVDATPPDFISLTFKELFDVLLNEGGAEADIYAQEGKESGVISAELSLAQLSGLDVYEDHSYAVQARVTSDAKVLDTSSVDSGVTTTTTSITPVNTTTTTSTPTSSPPASIPLPPAFTTHVGPGASEASLGVPVYGIIDNPPSKPDPVTTISADGWTFLSLQIGSFDPSVHGFPQFAYAYAPGAVGLSADIAAAMNANVNSQVPSSFTGAAAGDAYWIGHDGFGNTFIMDYYTGQYVFTLNHAYSQTIYGDTVNFNYQISEVVNGHTIVRGGEEIIPVADASPTPTDIDQILHAPNDSGAVQVNYFVGAEGGGFAPSMYTSIQKIVVNLEYNPSEAAVNQQFLVNPNYNPSIPYSQQYIANPNFNPNEEGSQQYVAENTDNSELNNFLIPMIDPNYVANGGTHTLGELLGPDGASNVPDALIIGASLVSATPWVVHGQGNDSFSKLFFDLPANATQVQFEAFLAAHLLAVGQANGESAENIQADINNQISQWNEQGGVSAYQVALTQERDVEGTTVSNLFSNLTHGVITEAIYNEFSVIHSNSGDVHVSPFNAIGDPALILTDAGVTVTQVINGVLTDVNLPGNRLIIEQNSGRFALELNHGYANDNQGITNPDGQNMPGYTQLVYHYSISDGDGSVSATLTFQIADSAPNNIYAYSQPAYVATAGIAQGYAFSQNANIDFGFDGFKAIHIINASDYDSQNYSGGFTYTLGGGTGSGTLVGDMGTLTFYVNQTGHQFGEYSYVPTNPNGSFIEDTFFYQITDGDGTKGDWVGFSVNASTSLTAMVVDFGSTSLALKSASLFTSPSLGDAIAASNDSGYAQLHTGWIDNSGIANQQAILMYDSGFGDSRDGMMALNLNILQFYDGNSDHVIDSQDSSYSKFELWFDNNNDGKIETGELKQMSDYITSINLDSATTGNSSILNGNFVFNHVTGTDNLAGNVTFTEVNLKLIEPSISPVVLDLGENGVSLVSAQNSHVTIGMLDGSNDTSHIGWIGTGSGLLVYDPNHTGKVTSLDQISFTGYTQGAQTDLEGLQAFDTNHNHMLDAGDAAYNSFQVWQDANGNGIVDPNEMLSLAQRNIASISLVSDHNVQVISGNTVNGMASYETTDGKTHAVADTAFTVIPAQEVVSSAHNSVDLSPLGNAPAAPAASAPTPATAEHHVVAEVQHSFAANFASAIDHAITSVEHLLHIQSHH